MSHVTHSLLKHTCLFHVIQVLYFGFESGSVTLKRYHILSLSFSPFVHHLIWSQIRLLDENADTRATPACKHISANNVHTDWQINTQTCAETHLYLTRLLFCVFPPSQTSKGERRLTSRRQTTILQSSVLDNAIVKCSTPDNLWSGGFKQRDINTQQIPPTANKICMAEDGTCKLTSVRNNNMQKHFNRAVFHRCLHLLYTAHLFVLFTVKQRRRRKAGKFILLTCKKKSNCFLVLFTLFSQYNFSARLPSQQNYEILMNSQNVLKDFKRKPWCVRYR